MVFRLTLVTNGEAYRAEIRHQWTPFAWFFRIDDRSLQYAIEASNPTGGALCGPFEVVAGKAAWKQFLGSPLAQLALQRTPMDAQATGCFRDVAAAVRKYAMDVLPLRLR